MATPILNQVSKDLAYKLQDPVSAGTGNGVRLSAAERLRYIIRSYRRLLRMVAVLYPNLSQKIFQDFFQELSGTSTGGGVVSPAINWSEIHEAFVREPGDEDYVRANFISPEDYLKVKHEENPFYAGNLNTDMFYWTRRSNDIYFLPAVTLQYELTYRSDKAQDIEDGGQGGAVDLDISTEYLDLLLSLACVEAYIDIGQGDVAGAYKQDVNEQLQLLAGFSNKMEQTDDTKET